MANPVPGYDIDRDTGEITIAALNVTGALDVGGSLEASGLKDTWRFVVNGKPSIGAQQDGAWVAARNGKIVSGLLWRGTAGGSGDTTVDINKNGTSVFLDQGNRPSVNFADGDNATDQPAPGTLTFTTGDIFTMDVDEVEAGGPKNVTVILEVQYD